MLIFHIQVRGLDSCLGLLAPVSSFTVQTLGAAVKAEVTGALPPTAAFPAPGFSASLITVLGGRLGSKPTSTGAPSHSYLLFFKNKVFLKRLFQYKYNFEIRVVFYNIHFPHTINIFHTKINLF